MLNPLLPTLPPLYNKQKGLQVAYQRHYRLQM